METWLARTGHRRGAVLTVEAMWALAGPWYAGRLDEGWRGRTPEESQAILESVGLTGAFWKLT